MKIMLVDKLTKNHFPRKGERVVQLLNLVHTDTCRPISIIARGGLSYFITFTNDHSRYDYVNLMKFKNETFEKFKKFKLELEK